MGHLWLEIIGVLILILFVGFFSASEVAVLSTRKSRLKELAEEGNRNARMILGFRSAPEHFLATIHVGIIFSLLVACTLGTAIAFEHLSPLLEQVDHRWVSEFSTWLSLGLIVAAIGVLVVLFGELIPKSFALRYSEVVALRIAPVLHLFDVAAHYPTALLTLLARLFLSPVKRSQRFTETGFSEEEFKLILEEGTKSGVIDKTEHELIESIFEFTDTTAKEVMIPRPDVVALNIDTPRDAVVRIVLEEGYSRLPVYRDTIDNIIGIVYTKDLLGLHEYRNIIIMQDIIRPAYFVPETMRISKLLRELQQRRIHMAVVIDEFGGTEGVITMEDIIEEIVGEIHDEYDEVIKDIEQAADGSFLVNGRLSVRDCNERFQLSLPEGDEYETLSGLLCKIAGRIPDLNEELVYENLSFTIVKKSQRRIRLVRVKKLERAIVSQLSGSASSTEP